MQANLHHKIYYEWLLEEKAHCLFLDLRSYLEKHMNFSKRHKSGTYDLERPNKEISTITCDSKVICIKP